MKITWRGKCEDDCSVVVKGSEALQAPPNSLGLEAETRSPGKRGDTIHANRRKYEGRHDSTSQDLRNLEVDVVAEHTR